MARRRAAPFPLVRRICRPSSPAVISWAFTTAVPTFYSDVFVVASIKLGQIAPVDFGATGATNLLDDAVMYSSVFVTNTQPIASVNVGLRVDHPRISDLVFI